VEGIVLVSSVGNSGDIEIWLFFRIKACLFLGCATRVMLDLGEMEKVHTVHSQRIVRPPLLEGNLVVGFFYGASQNGGFSCGVGVVIKCPVLGTYSIKMNCGSGTNTRGELLALWSVLFFAHYKQVSFLTVGWRLKSYS
jgi:hypothetical protein